MSDQNEPVLVSLNVEGWGSSSQDTQPIDREEWNSLDPAGRVKLLDELADTHAANYVSWGWHIEDPDDYAETS